MSPRPTWKRGAAYFVPSGPLGSGEGWSLTDGEYQPIRKGQRTGYLRLRQDATGDARPAWRDWCRGQGLVDVTLIYGRTFADVFVDPTTAGLLLPQPVCEELRESLPQYGIASVVHGDLILVQRIRREIADTLAAELVESIPKLAEPGTIPTAGPPLPPPPYATKGDKP